MNKAKDKRIKKLKRKRIWPSVLGLAVILILCTFVLGVMLGVTGYDIVQRKILQSGNQSTRIAQLYEKYDGANGDDINESVQTYINICSDVEAVRVENKNKELLWASDERQPNLEYLVRFPLLNEETKSNVQMIIEEDSKQIFTIEGDTLDINENIFNVIANSAFITGKGQVSENTSIIELKLWMVVPVNELNVYVLNQINICTNDLLMFIMSMLVFMLLMGVLTIYYIISFISVIVSMRRTAKIVYTDMVTGGDNWLYFVKKSTTLLKRNRRKKCNYAMIHLKMRKYRSFCTCFGVREGEELIEKFYRVLKKNIMRKEAMAHQENAGFGLLLMYENKEQLLERISQLESMLDAVLPNMKLYFEVGVYQVEVGELDVEQLYNNALVACDLLGEEAENQVAFFDIEMNKQKLWERKVEDEMDRALQNKEFQVYLQPKISTDKEELGGAEALVRWIHPTEGFIPPNRFIPIFEQNGFILKLDDYMLEEIAKQQAQWMAEGRKIVPISVNVSRAHFTREDLAEHICAIVDKYQVPHEAIELELTESAFFDDKNVLLSTVEKLRDAGFVVSMDDFGAGYSSLNSLKELHIDVLKIDADFFRGADVEERGMLIVSEVIDLAKKLDMKIVAEGIESREQVDFLVEQECDLIQGYFFAKPMPIHEFAEKYRD